MWKLIVAIDAMALAVADVVSRHPGWGFTTALLSCIAGLLVEWRLRELTEEP